jgi:hypothetical protein
MNSFRFDFFWHCYVVGSSLVLGLKPVNVETAVTFVESLLVAGSPQPLGDDVALGKSGEQ